jgi:hypothetical protein
MKTRITIMSLKRPGPVRARADVAVRGKLFRLFSFKEGSHEDHHES